MKNKPLLIPRIVMLAVFTFGSLVGVFAQKTAIPAGLEVYLKSEMQKRKIPGLQIAIVRGGRIVMQGAYGLANIENSVPVTRQTVFSINSATKSFTGVAIMQLVEAGKIDLDAPVSQYLDGLPTAWQAVKIRQLLSHTSGIPNIMDGNGTLLVGDDFDGSWAKVQTLPMDFEVGERFSYNQTNYVLIGKIIDKLSGQPFIEFIKENQFKPAGMTSAGWGDFTMLCRIKPSRTELTNTTVTNSATIMSHFHYLFGPVRELTPPPKKLLNG